MSGKRRILDKKILKKFKLFEDSLSDDSRMNIKRINKSENFLIKINRINKIISEIKDKCSNLDYSDISFVEEDGVLEVSYNYEINLLFLNLKNELIFIRGNKIYDEISNKIFGDGYKSLFLFIDVDVNRLNQIDIINGLPYFIKNIGLGKKIYKSLIKEIDYISSFSGNKPSLDSNLVWNSISKDKELFTFSNDNNLISFWNELDFNYIIECLSNFYKIKGSMEFDKDFLYKFKLNKKELIDILT